MEIHLSKDAQGGHDAEAFINVCKRWASRLDVEWGPVSGCIGASYGHAIGKAKAGLPFGGDGQLSCSDSVPVRAGFFVQYAASRVVDLGVDCPNAWRLVAACACLYQEQLAAWIAAKTMGLV